MWQDKSVVLQKTIRTLLFDQIFLFQIYLSIQSVMTNEYLELFMEIDCYCHSERISSLFNCESIIFILLGLKGNYIYYNDWLWLKQYTYPNISWKFNESYKTAAMNNNGNYYAFYSQWKIN